MDAATVKKFQTIVREQFEDAGMETAFMEGAGAPQTGGTLRMLLPAAGTGGDMALLELAVFRVDDELDLLTFYTTVLTDLDETAAEALCAAASDWNLTAPIGAFGVYRAEGQLYHKYSLPFPSEADADTLATSAIYVTELIFDVIARYYGDICALVERSAG